MNTENTQDAFGTDDRSLLGQFDRDGYVHLPQFLAGDPLQSLKDRLKHVIDHELHRCSPENIFCETKNDLRTLKQIQKLFELDPLFHEMIHGSSRFRRLAELLLGTGAIGVNMQYFDKPPGASRPTPPHQDGYYFMLEPCEALTMWLAVDSVDRENGCIRYCPGSHRGNIRPHGPTETLGFSQAITDYSDQDRSAEVPVVARSGDLLVHHALTIHRAESNRSTHRHRRAIGLIYYSIRAKESPEKQARHRALMTRWKSEGRI